MRIPSRTSDDNAARVTTERYRYSWTHDGRRHHIVVEEGFRYKPGVSVRFGFLGLLDIFAPTYSLENASCLHDWVYANRRDIPREAADALMEADPDDPTWVKKTAHAIVSLLGWTVW